MNASGVRGEAHEQSMEQDKARHESRGSSLHDKTVEVDYSYKLDVVDSVIPGEDDRVRTASVRYTNPGDD